MPEEARTNEITLAFLDAFADAWNRHDVDAIMSAITEDCVFEASAGVGVRGTVYDGQRQVRKGVEAVFEQFPDAIWSGPTLHRGEQGRDRMGVFRHPGRRRSHRGPRLRRVHVQGRQDRREELLPEAAKRLLNRGKR